MQLIADNVQIDFYLSYHKMWRQISFSFLKVEQEHM